MTAVSAPATASPTVPPTTTDPGPAGLSTLALITLLLGPFLSMLDFFIVNVALPTIGHDLHTTTATLELVVAGYGIGYAVLLVLGGRLGDAFGRRRLGMGAMAAFTIASLGCGIAPTATILVIARVVQGASAAMMVPQSLATIQAATSGHHRARAMGMYGATAGIAAAAGQLLGGVLVGANLFDWGWRPIFLVNVPVGVVGLILTRRVVPATRSPHPARIDGRGTVLLAVLLTALLLPLLEGRSLGWPWWGWVSLAAVLPLTAVFVAVERREEQAGRLPLLPPMLLRVSSIRRGLLIAVPFFAGFGGFMFTIALVLQTALHEGALEAGLALTPMAVAFLVSSLLSPRLFTRHGRPVLAIGSVIQAAGLLAMIGTVLLAWPDVNPMDLAPAMAVVGFGQGLMMPSLFRVILADVPPALAGVGGGVMVTMQQSALALGVATLGSLFLSFPATSHGAEHGFITLLSINAAIAIGFALATRLLPRRVV
ncbi:MAG: MFS transporter [Jatrophihabitans sp.]